MAREHVSNKVAGVRCVKRGGDRDRYGRAAFSNGEREWSFYPRYSVASFTRRAG
jgi:hypothetical protein